MLSYRHWMTCMTVVVFLITIIHRAIIISIILSIWRVKKFKLIVDAFIVKRKFMMQQWRKRTMDVIYVHKLIWYHFTLDCTAYFRLQLIFNILHIGVSLKKVVYTKFTRIDYNSWKKGVVSEIMGKVFTGEVWTE